VQKRSERGEFLKICVKALEKNDKMIYNIM
jgi:hypothetical protein